MTQKWRDTERQKWALINEANWHASNHSNSLNSCLLRLSHTQTIAGRLPAAHGLKLAALGTPSGLADKRTLSLYNNAKRKRGPKFISRLLTSACLVGAARRLLSGSIWAHTWLKLVFFGRKSGQKTHKTGPKLASCCPFLWPVCTTDRSEVSIVVKNCCEQLGLF